MPWALFCCVMSAASFGTCLCIITSLKRCLCDGPWWVVGLQGTADAVRQYLWLLEEQPVQDFLILAGDHLYRMDYLNFIKCHRETGADITVAALPMDEKRATAFGLMKIDNTGRIVEFAEKPKGEELKKMQVRILAPSSDSMV